MTSGIYLITNKINGHKYAGGSVNIEERIRQHKNYSDIETSAIDKAIKKYGPENFSYQIITELQPDWKIIGEHERYWIKFYNAFEDKNHYNLTEGGGGISGFKKSPESRKKQSERMKGENNPFYNQTHTKKSRKKMSDSKKGKPNPHTKEQDKKIGDKLRGRVQEDSNGFRHDLPSPEEIYNEWKSGLTQKQLTEKYNCGERTIGRRIKRYKEEIGING
jgi:group I intron endonuclease